MKKLNNRPMYILVDTETANGFKNPLVYDIGFVLIDDEGNIYKRYSYVIRNIFYNKRMMDSAYYAKKIPQYVEDINNGLRKVVDFKYVYKVFETLRAEYNIQGVVAHNVSFDKRSTSATYDYVVPASIRDFFPDDTVFFDTMTMAKSALKNSRDYYLWCWHNNFLNKFEKPRYTAEIIYRYIVDNAEFVESHTALEDALIESEIFKYCRAQGVEI